ncbi:MAG: threonine synthase [Opitutales bacterium]
MKFISTRGQAPAVGFSEAIAIGLAPDGGLYLPAELPDLSGDLEGWSTLTYPGLAYAFFRKFATDMDPAVLRALVDDAYSRFRHPDIAPLVELKPDLRVLELFHGPTLAFKDFGLQLLGNLYGEQISRTGRPIHVLGATSGDTGAAAIEGLRGKPGVHIFILYPDGRVAPLQERQMACTGDPTVFPLAIQGSFDDAQAALKEVFGDRAFREKHALSAVNSINLARGLAQSVYYLYAWFRLPADQRERTVFVVPTGNFGNVLAGWMLSRMGVPMGGFRVATNQNDILYRLFTTGSYEQASVAPSLAPSMDIQVASNFERFLYYAEGGDTERVRSVMQAFRTEGRWSFESIDRYGFSASRLTDEGIPRIIRKVYEEFGYSVDPHTACGFADLPEGVPLVVLATAHPAKFPDVVKDATGVEPISDTLEALKTRAIVKHPVDPTVEAIEAFIAAHPAPEPS